MHHVGLLCENLEVSLGFYRDVIGEIVISSKLREVCLGLEMNPDRPDKKLPYRGAWLWIGSEMIHLMELPNPDPKDGRPEHGGRDRHFCVGIENMDPLVEKLRNANITFTESMSGRRAVFFRDPGRPPVSPVTSHVCGCLDMNCLEVFETKAWKN